MIPTLSDPSYKLFFYHQYLYWKAKHKGSTKNIAMDPEILARFERLKKPLKKEADSDTADLAARLAQLTGAPPVALQNLNLNTTKVSQAPSLAGHYVDYTSLVLTSPQKPGFGFGLQGDEESEEGEESDEIAKLLTQVQAEVALEDQLEKSTHLKVVAQADSDSDDEDAKFQSRLRRLSLQTQTQTKPENANANAKESSDSAALGPPPPPPASLKDLLSPAKVRVPVDDAFCCICADDATLACPDCDNDLYCQACFKRGHNAFEVSDLEMTKHIGVRIILE
ncbi:UNVERIFIED_CONTAM: Abscission/NoCut checkpoint regulator [Siphonaria sp. JEL0065]|nr:Abscission/NoCut checkpoint regulator [Siphonaria sp. JEL0065]